MIASLRHIATRRSRVSEQTRQRMIDETNAFLSWAIREDALGRSIPRLPRRRLSEGGFAPLLRHRGARAAVRAWWHHVFVSEWNAP